MKDVLVLALLFLLLVPVAWAVSTSKNIDIIVTASSTLTETTAPGSPTIPDSSSLGAIVQQFTNTWASNEAFVGANTFVLGATTSACPNGFDCDTYSISGDFLIVAPNGNGVGGRGGTTQHVTTVAVQMDLSADGTIVNAPSNTMLANKWGIWNWGPLAAGRTINGGGAGHVIYLNGRVVGSGDIIEVAHGGVLYAFGASVWYTWDGMVFTPSAAP